MKWGERSVRETLLDLDNYISWYTFMLKNFSDRPYSLFIYDLLGLHEYTNGFMCNSCSDKWPCSTIELIRKHYNEFHL